MDQCSSKPFIPLHGIQTRRLEIDHQLLLPSRSLSSPFPSRPISFHLVHAPHSSHLSVPHFPPLSPAVITLFLSPLFPLSSPLPFHRCRDKRPKSHHGIALVKNNKVCDYKIKNLCLLREYRTNDRLKTIQDVAIRYIYVKSCCGSIQYILYQGASIF